MTDVNAVATRDARGVSVLLWHYHDDDVAGVDAAITLALDGWSGPQATVRHHRMDADHSNAYAVWRAMGSPAELDGADYARLERAGQLAAIEAPGELRVEHGTARLSFILPRQGVSLIRFE